MTAISAGRSGEGQEAEVTLWRRSQAPQGALPLRPFHHVVGRVATSLHHRSVDVGN
jgi:hypothetical protein